MEYSNHYAVYGIRYFNVIFYLLAATEMDAYKINLLGEQIENGRSIKMRDMELLFLLQIYVRETLECD